MILIIIILSDSVSETLYMRIFTQNIACSQCQMHTCIHHSVTHYEHTTSKYGCRTSDQFIWLVLEKKTLTEAVNAYLMKNSKREGKKRKEKGHSHKWLEGLCGSMGV